MLRVLNAVIVTVTIIHTSFSQIRKVYSLENNDQFDKVILFLKATSNSCFIHPANTTNILNVFSHSANDSLEPEINSTLDGRTDMVHIDYERSSEFFVTAMTYRLFNRRSEGSEQWDYYLSNHKPMELNLDYAIGNAEIDLSSLPVERLMIRSGNADVKVEYQEGKPNLVSMDTLFVKVDMGSLTVNRINYSNARNVIADVVFGGLFFDYSDAPDSSCTVKASVGAGTMVIGIPESAHIPVMIVIHDSPLCHVRLPKNFRKTGKDQFVNEYYRENSDKCLSFDLDVALGHINFINK